MKTLFLKTLFVSVIYVAVSLHAGVTNLVWYRLGENDPWATISGAVTNTTDFIGGAPLKGFGAAQYYNSVSSYLEEIAGTTLCAGFNGVSGFLSNAPIVSATNSFCVELWVRPNTVTGGPYFIVGNGNLVGGGNGWGIFQQGADYKAILGGVTTIEPVLLNMAVAGQWTHLALVQDVDLTVLYVNGVALGSTSNQPRPPTIGFALGRHPQLPAGEFFNGTVDEVRVFRFGTGQFSSYDLLVNPRAGTFPPTGVTGTNALLRGLVNPTGLPTTWWFEWGTTTDYGNVTPAQSATSAPSVTNITHSLMGLGGGVTYHYRALASNALTGIIRGEDQSFSTPLFVNINAALPPPIYNGFKVWNHTAAWGDFDGDGRLDVVLSGAAANSTTMVSRNTGTGFSNAFTLSFRGPISWTDFNNDNRLDVAADASVSFARNTGVGFNLFKVPFSVPNGYEFDGQMALDDYNGDGQLDIFSAGALVPIAGGSFQVATRLALNKGGNFTEVSNSITSMIGWSAAGDYDGDGRPDLAMAGVTNSNGTGPTTQIWRNTPSGFSNANANLPNGSANFVTWCDYDNDGRLDLTLQDSNGSVQVWRNTGTGFTNIQAGFPPIFGSVDWGDYDNDGRSDLLLFGQTTPQIASNEITCQLWRNTGAGFVLETNARLPSLWGGSAVWGDYDNDGRLDILFFGFTNGVAPSGPMAQIWRNFTPVTNRPPTSPSGLSVSVFADSVTFRWNASSDLQTPTAALTYNLRVGTTSGGTDIVSPMSLANGRRMLPTPGNVGARLMRTISGLPLATRIYWSVQAVDNGFAGSPFAPEQSFTLGAVFTPTNGIPVPGDINGDGIVSQFELGAVLTNLNGNGVLTEANLNVVLSNYFTHSPWLQMTNVAGLGGTNVTFALTNSLAGAFSVEYSTNLNATNWQQLGPATPRYLFTDTNAFANPPRYYRLRWP